MRKYLAIFAVFTLMLTACSARGRVVQEQNREAVRQNTFCPTIQRTKIDFSVLNDTRALLARESVFIETAQNPRLVLNHMLESLFGYLGVGSANVPDWARQIVNDELAKSNGRAPDFSVLNQVVDKLLEDPQYEDLKDPSRMEELLETIIQGAVDALGDPFAQYMAAELWLTGFADNTGRYTGLGISTNANSRGEIEITSVSSGAPAEKAGLEIGDVISKVNGLPANDCTSRQFILRMRAIDDRVIKLDIERRTRGSLDRESLQITVVKEEIEQLGVSTFPSVELPGTRGTTLEDVPYRCGTSGGIGEPCPFADEDGDGVPDILYVKIHEFTDQMRRDLEYALRKLDAKYGLDSFKGVVVDVRGNPGGLVSATVAAVDFFLDTNDVILKQKDASGITTTIKSNKVTYIPPSTPVAVIMDDGSASGAEVFAAALRDNGRAVVVNQYDRSRGKGTVNRWFTLRKGEYGAIYVSVAMWLTPNGEFIETRDTTGDGYDDTGGLKPDIHTPWSNSDYTKNNQDVNYDPTLQGALDWIAQQLK